MPSVHARAATLPQELFLNLSSFVELERRIAALPSELQRGDAMEIFVEAFLRAQPLFQVQELWLVGAIPLDVRSQLNLPADAKGIDGVFQTRVGGLVPYQVKFRAGRPQIGVGDVATFLGLTERARDRLLITNSVRYAKDIENRDALRIVGGVHFDALTPSEFAEIEAMLSGHRKRTTIATLRPHQEVAVRAVIDQWVNNDRATVVMPCGTGKTLVSLRATERQSPETVLVLLPSLALVSQCLAEWAKNNQWGSRFEYLCVCSDASVAHGVDDWRLRRADAPFPVETTPANVHAFLSRPLANSVRVIFATYQSSAVVAAGLPAGFRVDVGVFDEAHKTAGVDGAVFTFALEDSRLPIRKRLFLTATPRVVDIRRRDKEGDFKVVSMSDESVYGPCVHELSFAAAVENDLICDYRAVIATVDTKEISEWALAHGVTLVEGDLQATRWVGKQVAIQKAIRATEARKVITFHSRVAQAKEFAGDTPRGIKAFLPEFSVSHVNGSDPMAVRRSVLAGFCDSSSRIVTNARCLTEGVDLPAVDMVVFVDPRKSKVDIVQAVGRAMRKPPGGKKQVGYVVIPVLLSGDAGRNPEAACANTDWAEVIDVLAALRDQDARLEEVVRACQSARGSAGAFDPRALSERVTVIGPLIALDSLERHIATVVVNQLGETWDFRFGELEAFKRDNGHCDVPDHFEGNPTLGAWLTFQRMKRRRGTLSEAREKRLEALGVVWDAVDALWEEKLRSLEAYKRRTGHCNVPHNDRDSDGLGSWLTTQRMKQRRGTLAAERVARLEAVGIVWDPREAAWDEQYEQLRVFKEREGHCNVPKGDAANAELAVWVPKQRLLNKKHKLSADRVKRLEALGFVWDVKEVLWQERLAALRAFKERHGHCNVPQKFEDDRSLARWVDFIRQARKRGKLSPDRISVLDALGLEWERRLSRPSSS